MKYQMIKFKKIIIFLSVLSLAFELDVFQIAGSGIKLWMLAVIASGLILLWDLYKKGFTWLKQSKILWLGAGLVFFSGLGILNSPQKVFSAKQLIILIALVILGVFLELNIKKYRRFVYFGLIAGILINSLYAIYQNVAFNFGWPNFEIMAARPNGFFPEPDWLGIYLALGLAPFLVSLSFNLPLSPLLAKEGKKSLSSPYKEEVSPWRGRGLLIYIFTLLALTALTITVARASWLALIAEMGIILLTSVYFTFVIPSKSALVGRVEKSLKQTKRDPSTALGMTIKPGLFKTTLIFISLVLISLIAINLFHLSRFNIPDRFRSIFFREHVITVAENPATGESLKINLEEIEQYRAQGYRIKENYVGDENVASREEKFTGAWEIIRQHFVLGSGLGITLIATNYEHNANNLFLEWWASAGIGGLLMIAGILLYLLGKGLLLLKTKPVEAALVLAGTAGFIIVNLFNASIFLAFAWFYLAWLLVNSNIEYQKSK